MALKGTGKSEFAKLMANHILGNVYGNVALAVMDSDGVSDESGENGGLTAPGLEDLLVAGLIHFFDPLYEFRCYKGALLNTSAQIIDLL